MRKGVFEAKKSEKPAARDAAPSQELAGRFGQRAGSSRSDSEAGGGVGRTRALETGQPAPSAPVNIPESNAAEALADIEEAPAAVSVPPAGVPEPPKPVMAKALDAPSVPTPGPAVESKAVGDRGSLPTTPAERINVLARLTASTPEEAARLARDKAASLGWSVSEVRSGEDSILFVLVPRERLEFESSVAATPVPEGRAVRRRGQAAQKGAEGARDTAAADAVLVEETVESQTAPQGAEDADAAGGLQQREPERRQVAAIQQQAYVQRINVIEVRIEPAQAEAAEVEAVEQ